MTFEQFVSGTVFTYPYLWGHQADRGETEGRKERPVVVGFRLKQKRGMDRIIVFPITTKFPGAERLASEIPDGEKRRAGLDPDKKLWIVFDDANSDVLGKSYYLQDQMRLGRFSRSYFAPVMRELINRRERVQATDRTR